MADGRCGGDGGEMAVAVGAAAGIASAGRRGGTPPWRSWRAYAFGFVFSSSGQGRLTIVRR